MARKVLLADDSVAVQKAVEATLEPKGFEVFPVSKGADAIREAKRVHPDVILLDSDLPDVDGYEICRRVKGDPDLMGIPVVLMSAGGPEDESSRAQDVGADGHLLKPFQSKDLIQRVLSLIDLTIEPTLKIEAPDMEMLEIEEGSGDDLELGELELDDDGVLDLTDEMESLEEGATVAEEAEELTFDDHGELDLEAPPGAPGARRGVRTEELDEISFEEELEELDLGELELEGAEDLPPLGEEGVKVADVDALTATDEVDSGIEFDEEMTLEDTDLTAEVDLLDTSEGKVSLGLETEESAPLGASAKPSGGLIDTDELDGVSLDEDTLDLDTESEEEVTLEGMEETGIEFDNADEETLTENAGGATLTETELTLEDEELAPLEGDLSLEETVIDWEEPKGSPPPKEAVPLEATSIEWEDEVPGGEKISVELGPEVGPEALEETTLEEIVLDEMPPLDLPEREPPPAKGLIERPAVPFAAAAASEIRVQEMPEVRANEIPEFRVKEPPAIRAKEAPLVAVGLLEEVPLDEEIASIRAQADQMDRWEDVGLQEVDLMVLPSLRDGLRLELVEEDFGVVDPFSEDGIRKELARNLQDMVERILTDLAPPIVERVAREIALERTEKIVMEEIERLKVAPEGA